MNKYLPILRDGSILFFFFIVFAFFALSQKQEVNWDFLNYHFYNGFSLFHPRLGQDYAPAGIQTYFNPLLDGFNYLLITQFNNPYLLRFILGGICGLNGFFLYKICTQLFKNESALSLNVILSLVVGMTAATTLSEVGSVSNDPQSALFIMVALFLITKAFEAPRTFILFLGAGLFLGMGAALKLTNLMNFLAAWVSLTLYLIYTKKPLSSLLPLTIGFLIGFLIFDGYFAYQLYHTFQNPVFPYYNNIFKSPDFTGTVGRDTRFGVDTLGQALLLPYRLMHTRSMFVIEPNIRDWRLAALFTLLFFFLLKWGYLYLYKKKLSIPTQWIFALCFTLIVYFIWVFEFGIYRYAFPLTMMLGPCIIFLANGVWGTLPYKKLFLILLTVLLIATTVRFDTYSQPYRKTFFDVSAPAIPANSMVLIGPENGTSFVAAYFAPSVRFINPDFPDITQDFIAQKAIQAHEGPLYITFSSKVKNIDTSAAPLYQFYGVHQGECTVVTTNMSDLSKYELCKLVKN